MKQFKFVLFVLLSVALAACAQNTSPPRDDDPNSRPTRPALSVSSERPDVGDEIDITFVVLSDLDYVVVDVQVCESSQRLEHWVYDRSSQLSPSRRITRSITHNRAECLRVIYTAVEDGDDLSGTPITTEIHVGDEDNDDGDDDHDRNTCNAINYFDVTLTNGNDIDDNDRVDTDNGFGFSVNWGVDRYVDDVDVTIRHDGDKFFHSGAKEDSKYTDWDDHGEGEYTAKLVVVDNGRACTRTIEFDVDDHDGNSGSDEEGRLTVQVDLDGGDADPDDFRIRVRDDSGDYVDTLRDNDRIRVDAGEYSLHIDDDLDYEMTDVDHDCVEVDDFEAEIDVDDGDDVTCEFDMKFVGDDDPEPRSCTIESGETLLLCDENGNLVSDGGVVSVNSGDHVTVAWSASGVYSSTWLQVYSETQGKDIYDSSKSSGRTELVFPTDIGEGSYEVIFTAYEPTRKHRVEFEVTN